MSHGTTRAAVVTGPAALQALRPEWEELADTAGAGFGARPSYGLAWLARSGHPAAVTTVRDASGRLIALAPLHRRRLADQTVLRWLGHGLGTVGTAPAVDTAAATLLWDALADRGERLQLTHVLPGDPAVLALRRDSRWHTHLLLDERRPVLPLPAGTTVAGLRGPTSLRRLDRYRTAAARHGRPLSLAVVQDLPGLLRRWPDVARVAAAADADRDRVNLCGPEWEAFTLPFLKDEARAGRLFLVGLLAGEQWVAHEVGLRCGTGVELWLSRFDPAAGIGPPGHLLLQGLLEQCLDPAAGLGVQRLDFGIGENDYKLRWTTDGEDVGTLTAATAQRSLAGLRVRAALGEGVRRSLGAVRRAGP